MPYSETTDFLSTRGHETDANRIVHGLWIGTHLSRMELLTLHSFTRFGHQFHLWVYDELKTPVPAGVTLRDANDILPRSRAFVKSDHDTKLGLGKNSYAPFSDLFRYKLLYEHGGIWVDMDVSCLRSFDFAEEFLFRAHSIGMIGNVIKVPARSELMRATFEEVDAIAKEDVAWLTPNKILNKHVIGLGLERYIRSDFSNADRWMEAIRPFAEGFESFPDDWYCVHWMNEVWQTLTSEQGRIGERQLLDYTPDKNEPFVGSTLHELYRSYGLIDPFEKSGKIGPVKEQVKAPSALTHALVWYETQLPFNILLANLAHADARIPAETVMSLSRRRRTAQSVYVLDHVQREYVLTPSENKQISYAADERNDFLRHVAMSVQVSNAPLLYSHRINTKELMRLQKFGITVVPVIEEARPDWIERAGNYNSLDIPFVVAGCNTVAEELRLGGCTKPVIVIRHEVEQRFTPEGLARGRRVIRDKFGIGDDTVLIGMIGPFKSQKAYTRAVRVLAALRYLCKAKLMILGSWTDDGPGRGAFEATMRQAIEADVIADLIVVSGADNPDPYFGAFDVFLNTSVYEALNLPLIDAALAGCPIVAADAGDNSEILPLSGILIKEGADIDAYVAAILNLIDAHVRVLPAERIEPDLLPRLWALLLKHGVGSSLPKHAPPRGTLFITANLHVGGPARSIVNLLTNLSAEMKTVLCVLDGISVESFRQALDHSHVPILTTQSIPGLVDRVEQILIWIDQLNVSTLCFWSVPPEVKLLLSKILSARDIRLIDVSPGPMLFDELEAAAPFQRRICLTTRQYIERLDTFVSLYREGTPEIALGVPAKTTEIIPLGVALPPRYVPLPPPEVMLPAHFDPEFAIGTCCRVVPDKKLEFLFDMMKSLIKRVPTASLTIVGGPDSSSMVYWEALLDRIRDERLTYIRFVGRHEDVTPFLATMKVFVMVSDRQGCPNASLEAMAMKRPVVANPSGGTGEQVKDGVSGFLVEDPEIMATRVEELLTNPSLCEEMGEAAYHAVTEHFPLSRMIRAYEALLAENSFA